MTTAGAAATAAGSTAIGTMSMSLIDVVMVQWAGGLGGRQLQGRRDGGQ
jgi:hypothetical protein